VSKTRFRIVCLIVAVSVAMAAPAARAVDPPYQADMQHLLETMGSLYFLAPLCGYTATDWRQSASDLIASDDPDDDRRQRLNGAFNQGYQGYARVYRFCSASAQQALTRLLKEAEDEARDLHSRYAE